MNKCLRWARKNLKIAIGYVLCFLAAVALAFMAPHVGFANDRWFNWLVLLFGAVLGWTTGILASPLNRTEQKRFSSYGTIISTFLSGFVVARFDQIFDDAMTKDQVHRQSLEQALLFGSAFLLGLLCTFIGRSYVRGSKGNRGDRVVTIVKVERPGTTNPPGST